MDKVIFDTLNQIYELLNDRTTRLRRYFEEAGYRVSHAGFYHHHLIRDGNGFVVENYPIPVLAVDGIGDVGIDIASTWMELRISKEKAISINYPRLARAFKIEVYGTDNYCDDFYHVQLDPCETAGKIAHSNEAEINICFYFDAEPDAHEIVKAFREFTL